MVHSFLHPHDQNDLYTISRNCNFITPVLLDTGDNGRAIRLEVGPVSFFVISPRVGINQAYRERYLFDLVIHRAGYLT